MDHFSDCVLNGKDPRTPGEEGLADMRVIAAIEEAAPDWTSRAGRGLSARQGDITVRQLPCKSYTGEARLTLNLDDMIELRLIRPAWLAWATSGSLSRD